MSTLQSESTGAVIQGTDSAMPSVSKPAVEVTFATHRPTDGRPLDPDDGRAGRIAKGIENMRKRGEAAGKVPPAPLKSEPTEPAKAREPEKPVEKKPEPKKPPEPKPEAKVEPTPASEPAKEAGPEQPTEEQPAPDVEPERKEPESKPDPVELATLRADLEQARSELAIERARGKRGGDDTGGRDAYIAKPTSWLREAIAKQFGLKPDAAEVNAELAYLQQELTIDAIGADTLDDSRKQQRIADRLDRSERLTQLGRAASEVTERETQQRQHLVTRLSTVFDGARAEFPDLDFVAQQYGTTSAEVAEQALDRWTALVRAGRLQATGDDAKDFREALRLIDTDLKTRLGKLQRPQPQITAPAPAPAPAQASPTGTATGAAAAQPSTAPGKKPASASPKTLPTSIAAAAPAVTAGPDDKKPTGPRVIEADDRAGFERRLKLARDRLNK